jgi:hypothetical protein
MVESIPMETGSSVEWEHYIHFVQIQRISSQRRAFEPDLENGML